MRGKEERSVKIKKRRRRDMTSSGSQRGRNKARRNIRPVHFPFTTHVCRRLWRLALFSRSQPAGDSADPAKDVCGHLRPLRHCATLRSTSTMGTSMVDEYPTLFRDSFLFGLFCLPLTFL